MKTLRTQMSKWWSRVGFEDAQLADRTLLVGTLAGALTALVALALPAVAPVPVAVLVVSIIALPRSPRWLLVLAALGSALVLTVSQVRASEAASVLAVVLGLALALEPRAWWRRGVALAAPLAAVAWALFVVRWLGARHLGGLSVLAVAAHLATGLFVAIAAVAPSVTFAIDAVEPTLAGDPKVRAAWLRLRRAAERVRDEEARGRLLRAAGEVAGRWVAARLEQQELESVDETAAHEARQRIEALDAASTATHDEELLRHFQQSLRVHRDTLEQFDGLRRRAERARARTVAEASWLDTAAFTLETTPALSSAEGDAVERLVSLSQRVGTPAPRRREVEVEQPAALAG